MRAFPDRINVYGSTRVPHSITYLLRDLALATEA
jgi:hypothetical protein